MELRQLRYLAAVSREGTFTAAARSESVAQPALWRQVRDLEREFGIALFERVGRGVRLTADGRAIVDQTQAALGAIDRLLAVADDLRAGLSGSITIACASPHLLRFLAPMIGRFRRSRPGVGVAIREYGGGAAPGRGIPEDLLAGLADLATGVAPSDDPRFDGFIVYHVRLTVAVSDDHPWRDVAAIEVRDLRDAPLVLAKSGAYSRGTLEAACRRAGFTPRVAFESATPTTIMALGSAGLGLPILVDDAIRSPIGRAWPILVEDGRPIEDAVRLVWRSGAEISASARAFIDAARSAVDQDQVATRA